MSGGMELVLGTLGLLTPRGMFLPEKLPGTIGFCQTGITASFTVGLSWKA